AWLMGPQEPFGYPEFPAAIRFHRSHRRMISKRMSAVVKSSISDRYRTSSLFRVPAELGSVNFQMRTGELCMLSIAAGAEEHRRSMPPSRQAFWARSAALPRLA